MDFKKRAEVIYNCMNVYDKECALNLIENMLTETYKSGIIDQLIQTTKKNLEV